MAESTNVGSVTGIWRFPVKSMKGERLEQGEFTEQGLPESLAIPFDQNGENELGQSPLMTASGHSDGVEIGVRKYLGSGILGI